MANAVREPLGCFQTRETSLGRGPKRQLNPIIEEDSDDGRENQTTMEHPNARGKASFLEIEAWLSPMSDDFPTPRAIHYLSAPVLPSSPSTISSGDTTPTASSDLWHRASVATENTVFEDLYDVSDEDEDNGASRFNRPPVSGNTKPVRLGSQQTIGHPTRLEIPVSSDNSPGVFPAIGELKKLVSPVPVTPSAQLSMSPAQMNFMGEQQALEVPAISAPPSLDGSLSSEHLAALSSPPTPVDDGQTVAEKWAGVLLQPDALATLHALSRGEDDILAHPAGEIDAASTAVVQNVTEMRQQSPRLPSLFTAQETQGQSWAPSSNRRSFASLTRLDIPSPSGFSSGLSPQTRSTWHPSSKSPVEVLPPTSTTAEQFYRCPWNVKTSTPPVSKRRDSAEVFYRSVSLHPLSSTPVEQVVEITLNGDGVTNSMPAARPLVPRHESDSSWETIKPSTSFDYQEPLAELPTGPDLSYLWKQQLVNRSKLDRTELWLAAQRNSLRGVDGGPHDIAVESTDELYDEEMVAGQSSGGREPIEPGVEAKQQVVQFSSVITAISHPTPVPSRFSRRESAYYRAFQECAVGTQLRDMFVQQLCRFEALQTQRAVLCRDHCNQLLGKYQLTVVPQSAKQRLNANVSHGDLVLTDDHDKLRKDKEHEAMSQMAMSTWHVASLKFLNGGRLISAPVTGRLARLTLDTPPRGEDVMHERARILDLGGQAVCDWAWHCALQYPNAKIYTVTTKAIRQMSNANIRGPPNHRQVAVKRLSKLPFADEQFDLISARELHGVLKLIGENGEDEWESCLSECMRVLKPGGYLEFSIMDSDIINAGPLGLAKSVEFGFVLKTLGYDPSPSKLWLSRLARAGFSEIRRAWLCLPLGAKMRTTGPSTQEQGHTQQKASPARRTEMMGSSEDIASVCSIAGGWSWERWLLRCEMERVAGKLRLADTVTTGEAMTEASKCLDGVHAVMEEGRGCKAAFRMLRGYARKPPRCSSSEVIQIALAP